MSEFSIPRLAVAARLVLTEGGGRDGEIYVMEHVPKHTGVETPLEMLNRPEGFFPFRPARDGGVLLVAKARTIVLSTARAVSPQDPARLSAAKTARLELTLADGAHLQGWAMLELPTHHTRLLDYLNASAEPFFAVTTADRTHFVNRAHVLYARPEE
ncbi:MAG: hypothetical protein ACREMN_02485 [Gemmatimonadales bacterium]